MPHVLVAGKLHDSGISLLSKAGGITFDHITEISEASYIPLVDKADALIIRTQQLDEDTIARASRLKFVSRHGVGYDAIDTSALSKRAIPLAIVGDVNSVSVAEHALMLMLAAAKRLIRNDKAVRGGNWGYRNQLEAQDLAGKRLLILGYGRIGRRLAVLAAALGMTVEAYDPFIGGDAWPSGPAARTAALLEGLGAADIVSINLPKTDAPVIGPDEIAAMKPGAILVNTARGGTVDEEALALALAEGRIAAAGIDVFSEEPPPPDHPLFRFDQVILTPHVAGLSRECAERMAISCAQNVLDFFDGTLNSELIVNKPVGHWRK